MIQRIFHLKSERQRTLRLLFGDCRHNYFHSLTKFAFPLSKGQLCLYDKQNNTWLLTDMEFLFSCSTRREIPYLRAPMYYSLLTCHRTNAVSELKSEPQFFLAIFCTAIYVDLSILNGLAHFCRLWDHLYALGQYEYSYEQKKKGRVRNRVYVLKSCNKRVVLNVDWKLIAISLLERHVRIKAYRVRIICLQNHKHLS